MRGRFAFVALIGTATAAACTYAFDLGPPGSSSQKAGADAVAGGDERAATGDDGGQGFEASRDDDAELTGCSPPGCTCATGTCDLQCPLGGNCTFACKAQTSCDTSCVSSRCLTQCESKATCNVACVGGDCSARCAAGSICRVACPSGGCRIECEGGECSFSYCPSNDCRCSGPGCT